jgi:hypothetical protein
MKTNQQIKLKNRDARAPLFSSPWMALFLQLRNEWPQLRPSAK